MATTFNSIGLVCDIIGAVLLKRMKIAAKLGFGLMILGFVLQLVSNYSS